MREPAKTNATKVKLVLLTLEGLHPPMGDTLDGSTLDFLRAWLRSRSLASQSVSLSFSSSNVASLAASLASLSWHDEYIVRADCSRVYNNVYSAITSMYTVMQPIQHWTLGCNKKNVCTCNSAEYASVIAALAFTVFSASWPVLITSASVRLCQLYCSSKIAALLAYRSRRKVSVC